MRAERALRVEKSDRIERIEITNFEAWGKLVKSWATGKNYFAPKKYKGGDSLPVPGTLQELKQQCSWANVGIKIPERVKAVQFVQSNLETLLLRLPQPDMVRESEQAIQERPDGYPLPDFYSEVFGAAEPHLTKENVLKFHAWRVGDYTIAQCG
ncbi:MAG: hypothetical protein JNL66_06950 [Alphaproteobacteria bacterium]|nr:hypothetical protein [Alphaproteobacteria bacterium]